nr:hypothetical protein [Spirochaetales bacterium]
MKKIKSNLTDKMKKTTEPSVSEATGFPIVGIGASAGGLAAFEAFFSGMPGDIDPGMAFVLVQHLAPDHKSILTDLVRRYTRMEVFEVQDGMKVQINCTYIIPPGQDMAFLNGTLQLLEPFAPRGQRLPIDFFFRSLAQDQKDRSIGIILSGTGSDGSMGVRAIKGEVGMDMAQTPESSEYDGMPRSAISTGMVDFELPPVEMAESLIAYAAHAFGKAHLKVTPKSQTVNSLEKIFILLRNQTGHDFSQYKPSTVTRRIERRMAVNQIDKMDDYVKYLQQKNTEIDALFRDILIGVTNFFRDTEAFDTFEQSIVPKIFESRTPGSIIRVWSVGCSTGEEAYSIAILLTECMEKLKQNYTLQIFATDIDPQAIATARSGIYAPSIVADITSERLARFFTKEIAGDGGQPVSYRINKNIRDLLIFTEHNVIKDPPFSRLDLIICRNLMIYMSSDLQKKIIPIFNYALNAGGKLFLGTSESIGEFIDLFTVLDKKSKIYQSKGNVASIKSQTSGSFLSPLREIDANSRSITVNKGQATGKVRLRELAEQTLLKKLAPASALVNSQGEIFYLHGRTGMYLEPDTGEVGTYNILKMAREGLRRELTTALHKAVHSRETVCCYGLRVKTNGHMTPVNLKICLVEANLDEPLSAPMYLVILEDGQAFQLSHDMESLSQSDLSQEGIVTSLRQELKAHEEYLQSANEELETSNEELKSSNEEMQSVNEELQSTNEELETSKEELQSVNEELATVNAE